MQWRKLYDNDPNITTCINKLTFKQYVREKIGDGYTAPLIDVWHSPEDVRIEDIPRREKRLRDIDKKHFDAVNNKDHDEEMI